MAPPHGRWTLVLLHHHCNTYSTAPTTQTIPASSPSSCLVTLVSLAFSIFVTLLCVCKFCSQLRHMVYHDCFSLLAHICVSLEFKHPQDSEKPKEKPAWLRPGCHGAWPCVRAATAPVLCTPSHHTRTWLLLRFHLPNLTQIVSVPKANLEHSGRELWEHSFSSVKLMDTVHLQSNLLEKIWPAPVWAGHALYLVHCLPWDHLLHPGDSFCLFFFWFSPPVSWIPWFPFLGLYSCFCWTHLQECLGKSQQEFIGSECCEILSV